MVPKIRSPPTTLPPPGGAPDPLGGPKGVPKVGGQCPPTTHMLCRTWARATPLARSWGEAQGEGGAKVCSWGAQRGGSQHGHP